MQDRYVGDVGDFGKYGLLRALADGLRLGVVWYLTPDEGHNADGKHVSYLDPSLSNVTRFRLCDPPLFDILSAMIGDGARSVRAVREQAVLPATTAFLEESLTFDGLPSNGPFARSIRLDRRTRWMHGALDATKACDLVFADPDHGIECGRKRYEKLGPKHAYLDELAAVIRRNQSLIVYHHLDRSAPAPVQVGRVLHRLAEATGPRTTPFALHFRRGTARAFLVVPSVDHESLLVERTRQFLNSPWSQHFSLVDHSLSTEQPAGMTESELATTRIGVSDDEEVDDAHR
ncbi:MAG: hypothetical protein ACRDJH_10810 [Thermomicrobiales bacterium]